MKGCGVHGWGGRLNVRGWVLHFVFEFFTSLFPFTATIILTFSIWWVFVIFFFSYGADHIWLIWGVHLSFLP